MRKIIFLIILALIVIFPFSETCAQTYKELFSEAAQHAQKGEHEEAIELYKAGSLKQANGSDVESHWV